MINRWHVRPPRGGRDGTWNVEIEVEFRPGYTAFGIVEHFASRREAREWARQMKRAAIERPAPSGGTKEGG